MPRISDHREATARPQPLPGLPERVESRGSAGGKGFPAARKVTEVEDHCSQAAAGFRRQIAFNGGMISQAQSAALTEPFRIQFCQSCPEGLFLAVKRPDMPFGADHGSEQKRVSAVAGSRVESPVAGSERVPQEFVACTRDGAVGSHAGKREEGPGLTIAPPWKSVPTKIDMPSAICKCNHFMRFHVLIVWLLAALFLAAGCSRPVESVSETDSRTYRRGKSLQREGRNQEALLAFLQVIDERSIAPESHLEAGLIHLNHLQDPLSAIYHFNRFLQFKGDGDQAETVRELIVTAQKEFLRNLPGEPFANEVDRLDLAMKFEEVQAANVDLRSEVATLRRELGAARERTAQLESAVSEARANIAEGREIAPIVVASAAPESQETPRETPSRYTVQSGDTLSQVSRKVYGTPGRWMDIYQANRDILSSPNSLRVGQELQIP